MVQYFAAPASLQLVKEVNERFPHRDKSSDGWLGDASHAARKSEHNPCWSCKGRNYGIVLARDIDIDDGDPNQDLRKLLLNELIGDPRVWYVISNGIIYSRTYNWKARKYTGANGHFHHVHVSFLLAKAWDTSKFFATAEKPAAKTKAGLIDISNVRHEFLRIQQKMVPRYSIDIARLQKIINGTLGAGTVKVDGVVGPKTISAWAKAEKLVGVTGDAKLPGDVSIKAANKGLYRVVA